MHKLLQRQIVRQFGSLDCVPAHLAGLIAAVDQAYRSADDDRALNERSLELTSQELMEKNRRLRQDADEIRQIITRVPEGLAVTRHSRYVFVNARWAAILGYQSHDLTGIAPIDLAVPEDRPLVDAGMNQVAQIRFRRKDGRIVLLELSPAQRIHFDGEPAFLVSARDVTERRRDEQRALLADRMASMGTLTAGIAHEINNPLAYVITNLGFVATEMKAAIPENSESEELFAALNDARDGAERVRRIVRDLKAFSRPDEETCGPVSLRAVAEAALKLTRNEIHHRARLVLDFQGTQLAEGNEARLGQVLVNLLVNATQATPDGAAEKHEIRVATGESGDRVWVEVSDSGTGMTPEVRAQIFDPFFTTKAVGVGTGLGLAICHGIVAGMGGEIEVQSEAGTGSTFRVTLPAAIEIRDSGPPPPPIVRTLKRGRILVIDDEPMIGVSVKRVLDGHDVIWSSRAKDALDRLRAGEEFDVVLCDLMMPEMTGMDLFDLLPASIRARTVFMTGGAFTPRAREFVSVVPNVKVKKPFETEHLKFVVANMLAT